MSKVRFSFDFLIRVRCHYVLLMVSIEIHRNSAEQNSEFRLKEDDILRAARMILPFTNLAISKLREVFSGEPSMTLKVITQTSWFLRTAILLIVDSSGKLKLKILLGQVTPFFLLGAEYGYLITLWRLCAIGTLRVAFKNHSSFQVFFNSTTNVICNEFEQDFSSRSRCQKSTRATPFR